MMEKRRLFRTQALKHYEQNKQQDILPGFVTPPVFLMLWLLLLIIGAATFFAWQEQVPTYTQALGVVLEQQNQPATVLLFVPSDSAINISVGQKMTLQVNTTGQQFQASVTSVDPSFITPKDADARYHLTGDTALVITRSSLVVHVDLTQQQASQVGDHMSISAQLQIGSRSLLSTMPDLLKNAFGG
jgi:hypothetical protein